MTPVPTHENGDAALPGAAFSFPGCANIKDNGKYVTVYAREDDGSMKFTVETWNTDINPMEMARDGHEHGEHCPALPAFNGREVSGISIRSMKSWPETSALSGGIRFSPPINTTAPVTDTAVLPGSTFLVARTLPEVTASAIRSTSSVSWFSSVGFGASFLHDLLLVIATSRASPSGPSRGQEVGEKPRN